VAMLDAVWQSAAAAAAAASGSITAGRSSSTASVGSDWSLLGRHARQPSADHVGLRGRRRFTRQQTYHHCRFYVLDEISWSTLIIADHHHEHSVRRNYCHNRQMHVLVSLPRTLCHITDFSTLTVMDGLLQLVQRGGDWAPRPPVPNVTLHQLRASVSNHRHIAV